MTAQQPGWQKVAAVFHERAGEYDQWFEESLLFRIELQTLRDLQTPFSSPKVEVGSGPGRFAAALGIELGIDPALAPLKIAAGRGVAACQAVGEALPLKAGAVQTIFLLFTLCFLEEPEKALSECYRALSRNGHLVVGFVNAESSWGEMLIRKGREGHPFYGHARFRTPEFVLARLAATGFVVTENRSSLFASPAELRAMENSRPGLLAGAGFLVVVARKAEVRWKS